MLSVWWRIGLWLGSLLLAVTVFSLFLGLAFQGVGPIPVFRVTLTFAFPAWCLSVPFVIPLKDAKEGRIGQILFRGILIGPVAVVLWGLILQLRDGDASTIWWGDPLIGIGGVAAILFALVVGFLATSFYVIALKIFNRRSRA